MRAARRAFFPISDIAALFAGRRAGQRRGRSMPTRSSRRALTCGSAKGLARARQLPARPERTRVAEKLDRLKLHEIDLTDGAVLETGCVYIVPLLESLALPADDLGLGQPQEFDRPARHLHPRHDRSRPGVRQDPGRLYRPALLEVSPRTFPIVARTGSRLSQIRFRKGNALLSEAELHGAACGRDAGRVRDAQHFRRRHRAVDRPVRRRRSVWSATAASTIPGWSTSTSALRRTCSTSGSRSTTMAAPASWCSIPTSSTSWSSREAVHVPPLYAAEMTPFDPLVGEFRVHYAGFFDPGFGHSAAGGTGSRAVLEVRSHEVPFILEHGQIVGRLVYEHMLSRPQGALRHRPRLQLPGAGPETVEALQGLAAAAVGAALGARSAADAVRQACRPKCCRIP